MEAAQRFEIDAPVAHGEIPALDQAIAQESRQVRMLEIGFVMGSGG